MSLRLSFRLFTGMSLRLFTSTHAWAPRAIHSISTVVIMSMASTSDHMLPAVQCSAEIEVFVQRLKEDRDLWQARALQFKDAFETQTRQLQELLDICVATQAELENERIALRCSNSAASQRFESKTTLAEEQATQQSRLSGDGKFEYDWQSPCLSSDTDFGHVKLLVDTHAYPDALYEVDRLLPGPLTHEARIEALLLKSAILRASGPKWLYDALAQCSEALELCDKLEHLESFLPRVQYQRGLCLYQLGMISQAHDAFAAVGPAHPSHDKAAQFRRSCDDELAWTHSTRRRSAFEEHRAAGKEDIPQLKGSDRESKRRRISSQLRIPSSSKSVRTSLPYRWVMSKTA